MKTSNETEIEKMSKKEEKKTAKYHPKEWKMEHENSFKLGEIAGYKEALKDVRTLIEKKYKKKGYNRFYYELLKEILEVLK